MSVPETPYTRGEMYLSAIADGDSGGIPERPYTRKEMYLDAIATGDSSGIPERPYTREEMYLDAIAKNGGGGGGDITVVSKAISSNGTYTAPTGKAYSPVTVSVPASAVDSGTKSITSNGNNQDVVGYAAVDVAVPNSYAAGDEGKVVSNGALVAQTAHAEVTQNGTIDTTLNNSVVVNVPGNPNENLNKLAKNDLEVWHATGLTYLAMVRYIAALKTVIFPDLTSIQYTTGNNLSNNSSLATVDFGSGFPTIPSNCFNGDSALTTIILRPTSIVSLRNINAFATTHFKSGGTGGTIYIPKVLYDHLGDNSASDYKAASNWSTVEGYGTIIWAKIEGSIYENTYADGTPIPTT